MIAGAAWLATSVHTVCEVAALAPSSVSLAPALFGASQLPVSATSALMCTEKVITTEAPGATVPRLNTTWVASGEVHVRLQLAVPSNVELDEILSVTTTLVALAVPLFV